MVGCPRCTFPSIHLLTTLKLSQDRGRLPDKHISKHSCVRCEGGVCVCVCVASCVVRVC